MTKEFQTKNDRRKTRVLNEKETQAVSGGQSVSAIPENNNNGS